MPLDDIIAELNEAGNWDNVATVRRVAFQLREWILTQPESEQPALCKRYASILVWSLHEPRGGTRSRSGGTRRGSGRKPRQGKRSYLHSDGLRQWQRAITGIDGEGWGYEIPEGQELEILAHNDPDPWIPLSRYIRSRGGMSYGSWSKEHVAHLKRLFRLNPRKAVAPDVMAVEMLSECPEASGLWQPEDGPEGMLRALTAAYDAHQRRPSTFGKVRWYGRQGYRLMVATTVYASGHTRYHRLWKGGARLTTDQILHFICRIPNPGHLCGFALGYDWTMWLLDLPPADLLTLKLGKEVEYAALDPPGEYVLSMRPGKFLIVSKRSSKAGIRYSHRRQVHDAFSWYQKSFIASLEETIAIPADKREIIVAGKLRRGEDDEHHDVGQESQYAATEMWALALMQRHLYSLCNRAGYDLIRFNGPGSLAERILDEHGVMAHRCVVDKKVEDDLLYAHFGGRFEDAALGRFERLYAYDLSSAYPWAATQLPSFRDATFEPVTSWQPGELGCYRVRFATPRHREYWAPFPVRDRGQRIFWPPFGETWVWSPELEAAYEYWPFRIVSGWRVHLENDERPLQFLEGLYSRRRELRAAGDPLQNVFRLGPNSLYGKLSQRLGQARHRFLPWASLITSMTRARLLAALRCAGPGVIIGMATDSVYTLEPVDFPPAGLGGLGDWELKKELDNVLIVGSGFMRAFGWQNPDGTRQEELGEEDHYVRTRGMRPFEVPWPQLMENWERFASGAGRVPLLPEVVKTRRFINIMLGLLWNHPEMMGSWVEQERVIRFHSDKSPEFVKGGIVPHQRAFWLRQRRQDRSAGLHAYDAFAETVDRAVLQADKDDSGVG